MIVITANQLAFTDKKDLDNCISNEEKYYNQLQEQGMEFIEVDTKEFADAMISGVLPVLTDSQKKIYDEIEALA